jgi:hypothetical protein
MKPHKSAWRFWSAHLNEVIQRLDAAADVAVLHMRWGGLPALERTILRVADLALALGVALYGWAHHRARIHHEQHWRSAPIKNERRES